MGTDAFRDAMLKQFAVSRGLNRLPVSGRCNPDSDKRYFGVLLERSNFKTCPDTSPQYQKRHTTAFASPEK